MKKLMILFTLFLLLVGCNPNKNIDLVEEVNRILELLPETYDSDYTLPKTDDSLTLVYSIDGFPLGDKLVYQTTKTDIEYLLQIDLSNDIETITRYARITMVAGEVEVSDELVEEINRIMDLLPNSFTEDISLPGALENYEVAYYLDGSRLYETLYFELGPEDSTIRLEVVVSNDLESIDRIKTIVQEGDAVLYEEERLEYEYRAILSKINASFPSRFTSNFTIPNVVGENYSTSFDIDCTETERGRFIYTAPRIDEECEIIATIIHDGDVSTHKVSVIMSSFDNLPRIPEVHITTLEGMPERDKEYVPATLTLIYENGVVSSTLNEVPLEIKLRGNSTLWMPKPSFKIKFDEKQSFLSEYKERRWVLLANHVDQTLIRDYVAFSLADRVFDTFTPGYKFVDVYVNGVYFGNYLLTDQIEVTNDRVDIGENEPDLDTGYIVEMDIGLYRVGLEESGENYFLLDEWIPFVVKSPKADNEFYLDGQKDFIEDYFNLVYNTLKDKDDYHNLIDEATFIDWFIVNEVFKNVDSGYSSVYFYKDKYEKLKMGPVWDFDISSGVPGYVDEDLRGPYGWYTPREDKNVFFYHLMQYQGFRDALKARWNELYEDDIMMTLDDIWYASDSITHSRINNFEEWDIIGIDYDWYTSPEVYDIKTYDGQVWFLYDWLEARIEWLNVAMNDLE